MSTSTPLDEPSSFPSSLRTTCCLLFAGIFSVVSYYTVIMKLILLPFHTFFYKAHIVALVLCSFESFLSARD